MTNSKAGGLQILSAGLTARAEFRQNGLENETRFDLMIILQNISLSDKPIGKMMSFRDCCTNNSAVASHISWQVPECL